MPNPIWKGSTDTKLQPNCPIYENSKEGPRYTLVYKGKYSTMIFNVPARLSKMADAPDGWYVDTIKLEKSGGGVGTMTVVCTPLPIPDFQFDNNQTQEVEWIEVQQSLLTHPIFHPTTADSVHPNSGLYELATALNSNNTNDFIDIQFWSQEQDALHKAAFSYDNGTAIIQLSANAIQYAMRALKGQDSYLSFVPQCRITLKNSLQPNANYCGVQLDPPPPMKIEGYAYLLTADRYTRDRVWSRVVEFTGFDSIDDIIYPQFDGGGDPIPATGPLGPGS